MADQKLTALPALAAMAADDLLYVVHDPLGVPVSRKISQTDFIASLLASAGTGQVLFMSGTTPTGDSAFLWDSTLHALSANGPVAFGLGSTPNQDFAGSTNNVTDNIQITPSDFSTDYVMGRMTLLNASPLADYGGELRGQTTSLSTSGSANFGGIASAYYEIFHGSTGNADLEGVVSTVENDATGDADMKAINAIVRMAGAGTSTNTSAVVAAGSVTNVAGAITNLSGVLVDISTNTGTLTNAYGVRIKALAGITQTGTFTTGYGLKIEDQTQAATNFAIKTGTGLVQFGDTVQATGYKSSDGSAGATAGPFTSITSITVKNGLITAITGS